MDQPTQQVNSNECQVLLAAIKAIQDANEASHNELRELISIGLSAVQTNIDANAEVTNGHLERQTARLDKINGSVADLYKKHEERGVVVDEFHELQSEFNHRMKKMDWIKKNWLLVTLLFIGSIAIVLLLLDTLGLRGIWNAVKEVKDVL